MYNLLSLELAQPYVHEYPPVVNVDEAHIASCAWQNMTWSSSKFFVPKEQSVQWLHVQQIWSSVARNGQICCIDQRSPEGLSTHSHMGLFKIIDLHPVYVLAELLHTQLKLVLVIFAC